MDTIVNTYEDIKVQNDFSNIAPINYNLEKSDAKLIKSCSIEREQNIQNSDKNSGSKIRFVIPSSDRLIDPASIFFSFKTKVGVANINYSNITNFLSELTIRDGYGNVIEKVEHYKQIAKFMRSLMTPEYKENTLAAEGEGAAIASLTGVFSALNGGSGATFVHRPYPSGFLQRNKHWLPLSFFRGLTFEFRLDNTNNTYATSPPTCIDAHIHYKSYELHDDVYQQLQKKYSKGLNISYEALTTVERSLTPSTNVAQIYNENVVMANKAIVFATGQNDLKLESKLSQATTFYLEINKQKYPEYGNDGNLTKAELFYLNKLNKNQHINEYDTKYANFIATANSFDTVVLDVDLTKYGNLSGLDLVDSEIKLNLKGLDNLARNIYLVISHTVIVSLKSGSSTEILM
jgi:hypothetical protein